MSYKLYSKDFACKCSEEKWNGPALQQGCVAGEPLRNPLKHAGVLHWLFQIEKQQADSYLSCAWRLSVNVLARPLEEAQLLKIRYIQAFRGRSCQVALPGIL